jgi:hypothetical protein
VGVIAPQLKAPPTALRNRKSGEETRGFNRLEEEQQTKPQELAVRNAEC